MKKKKIMAISILWVLMMATPALSQVVVENKTTCPVDIVVNSKVIDFMTAYDVLRKPTVKTVNIPKDQEVILNIRYLDAGMTKTSTIVKPAGSSSMILEKNSSGVYNSLFTGGPSSGGSSKASVSSGKDLMIKDFGLKNSSKYYFFVEDPQDGSNSPFAGICLKPMAESKFKADVKQGPFQLSGRYSELSNFSSALPQVTIVRLIDQDSKQLEILDSDFPESTIDATAAIKQGQARLVVENQSPYEAVGKNGALENVVIRGKEVFRRVIKWDPGFKDFAFEFKDQNGMQRRVTINATISEHDIRIILTKENMEKDWSVK